MAFCINCGQKLIEGAKFCANCGIATNNIEANTKRKMVYDGEIHKCPNCGETLKSFQGNCPSCGYELRGIKSSSSVKELTIKLEQIEKNRKGKKRFSFKNNFKFEIDEIDEQKVSLIRSFTIPNTKEDLYEFLFLSYSNIDFDSYDDGNQAMLFSRRAISDAWKASFEQAYQKSKIIFANDTDKLHEIQQLYDSSKKSIKKAKLHSWKSLGIVWGVLIGAIALIFIIIGIYSPISEKKELERLEAIVAEIEVQLEKGEYKYALMNADSLVYSGSISNDEQERQWVVKREYWIDKVLDEASKNGIKLEWPQDKDISETETSTETDTEGFFEGFMDGIQSGLDESKESWDEFKSTVNESTSINENTFQQFTKGYTKAEFDDYNSSTAINTLGDSKIYFHCTLDKTEILEAGGTTSILGYVTDDSNNTWLIQLHFVPAVSNTYFDAFIGEKIILRGVYIGFSEVKEMPVVVLDEMIILSTNESIVGMQKLIAE